MITINKAVKVITEENNLGSLGSKIKPPKELCGQFQLPYLHPEGKDILGRRQKWEDQRKCE